MTVREAANSVPAIDEPTPNTVLALGGLIEVDAGRVLVEPRGNLVLGFLDRDPVDVVDLVACLIVTEAMRAARKRRVVGRDLDFRARHAELRGRNVLRQIGDFLHGAAAASSRLRTVTQRAKLSTVSPVSSKPRERT